MGLFSLLSFLIVTSLGTLYPIYLSYKAIKANDLVSLEVLLMYWVIIGSVTALENTFGWLVNWLPFYYEAKTILILWLTLPQIQGSSYVYVNYLHPFLLEHESEIDALMLEAKEKCKRAGTDYLRSMIEKIKELVIGFVASQNSMNQTQSRHHQTINDSEPDPRRTSFYAMNLLRQFGPAAAAVFQPMQTRTRPTNHDGSQQPLTSAAAIYEELIYGRNQHPRSIQPAPLSGYQVPEFEESDTPITSHHQHAALLSSLGVPRTNLPNQDHRRVSSPLPSPSGDLGAPNLTSSRRIHHSSSGSGISTYDEILQDEASGSETEWISSRRRQHLPIGRTRTPLVGSKPRASTGQINQLPDRPESDSNLIPSSSSSSNLSHHTGPGWWFGWGGKPIEDLVKKKN